MNNKGFKVYHFIIIMIITVIFIIIVSPIVSSYVKCKNIKQVKIEYKKQQYDKSLPGMNYNNKGWYKDYKIKIFYTKLNNNLINDVNNFCRNKDVVQIIFNNSTVLVIYTNSLKLHEEITYIKNNGK